MLVVIDPGHPSYPGDRGVVRGSFVEEDFNYKLAVRVSQTLRTWLPGHSATLTRGYQETMDLVQRGRVAKHLGGDLLVSIHANANNTPQVKGLTTYYKPGDSTGQLMAQEIRRMAPQPLLREDGGVFQTNPNDWTKRANNVLKYHKMPAVLVECGFATNDNDLKALQDPLVQLALVSAILSGIVHGMGAL